MLRRCESSLMSISLIISGMVLPHFRAKTLLAPTGLDCARRCSWVQSGQQGYCDAETKEGRDDERRENASQRSDVRLELRLGRVIVGAEDFHGFVLVMSACPPVQVVSFHSAAIWVEPNGVRVKELGAQPLPPTTLSTRN